MKNFLLVAAVALLGFSSCRSSTCPAYAQKADQTLDKGVMVKAAPAASASTNVNG